MVRDLFLFCCFTGLAIIDLYNLKEENIKEFFDNLLGIVKQLDVGFRSCLLSMDNDPFTC